MTNVEPNGKLPSTIKLHSGIYYDILNPENHKFNILDIAHGLSHVCRFNGQCNEFYSVAQHSVMVCDIVTRFLFSEDYMVVSSMYDRRGLLLQALLHDATESVIGDVTRPLKALLPEYKQIEHRTEQAIFKQFKLPSEMHPIIKVADNIALKTEQRDLMSCSDDWYHVTCNGVKGVYAGDVQALEQKIVPLAPREARQLFLDRFNFLNSL